MCIAQLNIRSLLPKIDQIDYLLHSSNIDILCLNETWLDESINSNEVNIPDYDMFFKHRNRQGGGVAIYVKNNLCAVRRSDLDKSNVECLWIELKLTCKKLLLCSIYRPPSAGTEYYNDILDVFEKALSENKVTVISGDLNFNFTNDETLYNNPLHYIENLYGLTQLITDFTRVTNSSRSIIDIIFTSDPSLHVTSGVYKICLSDHYLTYTILGQSKPALEKQKHNKVRYRSYKEFNLNNFLSDLNNSNILNHILDSESIEEAWTQWKNEFLRICDKHAPISERRFKNRYKPWVNQDIVKLMYKRDHLHEIAIKNEDSDTLNQYKSVRNEINSKIKKLKKEYYDTLFKEGRQNSKSLFSELKKLSGGHSDRLNSVASNHTADDFNAHFSSIGYETTNHLSNTDNVWKGSESIYTFKFEDINHSNIVKMLNKLDMSSSLDVLNFDSKLLRLSSNVIAPSLTKLFNMSLYKGQVPSDWKYARVTPIYKGKGAQTDACNFRPISVIGHIAKLFEKEVQSQLVNYLIKYDMITLDQSAYRQFHSTVTCLHTSIDEWLQNIEDKLCTGVCFLDISKCFDTINHTILIEKLSKYGIKEKELIWFKSYLTDRQQIVRYKNDTSKALSLNIGVPQGSTLGPLLFMLFVNDLPLFVTDGRCSMFADDTIVYCTDTNVEDLTAKLNSCVNNLSEWYKCNKLVLNVNKTNCMIINSSVTDLDRETFEVTLSDIRIENVTSNKYLGVTIDETLTFKNHINELVKKISSKIGWLSRLRHIVSRQILELTYKVYIQPLFDYACTVWGCSSSNINAIQRLQNRAARIITGNFDIINVRGIDLVKSLKWLTVQERIEYFLNVYMYQCIHGYAPAYLVNSVVMACEGHDRDTRLSNTMAVQLPECNSSAMQRSFINRGSVAWNKLPNHLQNCTELKNFKSTVKHELLKGTN